MRFRRSGDDRALDRMPPGPGIGAATPTPEGHRFRRPGVYALAHPEAGLRRRSLRYVQELLRRLPRRQGQGKFQVALAQLLRRHGSGSGPRAMKSDDLGKVMPPAAAGGRTFSSRSRRTRCSICSATSSCGSTRRNRRASSTCRRTPPCRADRASSQRPRIWFPKSWAASSPTWAAACPAGPPTPAPACRWTSWTPSSRRRRRCPRAWPRPTSTTLDGAALARQGVIGLRARLSAVVRRRRQDAARSGCRAGSRPLRQGHPAVRHPAQHPLLQDLPQEGRRPRRQRELRARSRPA